MTTDKVLYIILAVIAALNVLRRLTSKKTYKLDNGKEVIQKHSLAPLIVCVLLAMTILSVNITGFNFAMLTKRMGSFFQMFADMFPPKWKYINKIQGPLFDTIKMSLLGSVVGAVISIPFAMLASTNVMKNSVVVAIVRLFFSLVRTLPTLVTALIATYMVGLGTLAGTIAIGVFSFAYMGKILYEEIETVDMGPFEAMEAMGATKTRAFITAVIPQIMPSFVSNSLFNFEGNVRYAAILGYVGAGGIGLILNEKVGWRDYPSVGMILIALYVAVFVIESISRAIRKRLV